LPAEREQDPPQLALIAGILIAVLGNLCARQKLAANLVTSNNDLRALVRARIRKEPLPEVPLTQGWRARYVLPELMAVLEGQRMVIIADVQAESPLEVAEWEEEQDAE